MREAYWEHIQEAKKRLADAHPDKSKYEILGMAREESQTQVNR